MMNDFDTIAVQLSQQSLRQQQQQLEEDYALVSHILEIYDQKTVAHHLRQVSGDWTRESLNRWFNRKSSPRTLTPAESEMLQNMLPPLPAHHGKYAFLNLSIYLRIGGIRSGFEAIGGQCVFTSEWNKLYAVRTYKANWYCSPENRQFNQDIRDVTLSHRDDVSDEESAAHIQSNVLIDVLLAGFPCQPFFLSWGCEENAVGAAWVLLVIRRSTLFFDVARIIDAKRPAIFVLENVKNLKSHDKGNTFRIIMETLDSLGYEVADTAIMGAGSKNY